MFLSDVNVLVYAHIQDAANHDKYHAWLHHLLDGDESFGMSDLVLSSFVRIVTNPRIYSPPTPLDEAFRFTDLLRSHQNCVPVNPGPRHWGIFQRLCREADARGNLVADAYLAALAIESGCEFITADRDFARFPGLRWRHPLDLRR